ncbi:MAG: carbohydrate binding family 9 domain-containing protein [Thermoanaerobaculia bacterium]|nr:carbohydrate binding family 9 domain-containing protein [Thermoanaerobaculia bacterium]
MHATRSLRSRAGLCGWLLAFVLPTAHLAGSAAHAAMGPEIRITRTATPVVVDGDLSDPIWQTAEPITDWLETNPGDNIAPKVRSVAWLAYDDDFFYAAFEFDEPDPKAIRAPLGDRDNVRSYTDYGGVIVDSQNDGHTAQMFLANARGIQYDALTNDASGEDNAPDYFWDSAAKITATGWVLEIRIPFSSLRYTEPDPAQWGILLYRNRPRDFRYQMFTSRLPRDSNCFICNARPLVGLAGLSAGSHYVVAPYVSANQSATPSNGLGSPLAWNSSEFDGGVDAKWIPNPSTVIDATVNPDFSQIESDAGQISANERFALFFPEKRPFFLEGVNLLATPIQAVYTRTFTAPSFGLRATGGTASTKYTALVGQDDGGGSVILPGPEGSGFADQDFESLISVARVRHDFSKAFVSFLYTGRDNEGSAGGGSNRVAGPDFEWRPTPQDTITGQFLYSWTETPERPDLAAEWDGRKLSGHAAKLWANHATETWDLFGQYEDFSDDFRADNGFVPQVGYRMLYVESGRTWHPVDKKVSRLRLFTVADRAETQSGELLSQEIVPGFGLDATWNSFVRFEFAFDEVVNQGEQFERFQFRPRFEIRPGKIVQQVTLQAVYGDDVDFANNRPAEGWRATLTADLQPTNHLALGLSAARRTLDVEAHGLAGTLFTADLARLRAVYTFNAKSWLRLIAEYQTIDRDPALYDFDVRPTSGDFGGSAVFAYKLNWQTVLFLGVGDERTQDPNGDLQALGREAFFKISYAFQH